MFAGPCVDTEWRGGAACRHVRRRPPMNLMRGIGGDGHVVVPLGSAPWPGGVEANDGASGVGVRPDDIGERAAADSEGPGPSHRGGTRPLVALT